MIVKKKKYRKDFKGIIREIHKESIFQTLERVVKKEKLFDIKEKKTDISLNSRWLEIVGKDLGSISEVKVNKTGDLIVEVKNSVAVQEIKMKQNEIIEQFKSGVPIYVFKKITIKMKT